MRATRSGIVIGLALALLVPGGAVGQEASPSAEPSPKESSEGSSIVRDPTGDLHDIISVELQDGPAYMDITQMTVEVKDGDLWVTFETAGDIPSELDPPLAPGDFVLMGYGLMLDTDDDGTDDVTVLVSSSAGWTGEFLNPATNEATDLGAADVVANTLAIRVPLATLGDPKDLRFRGVMQAVRLPDESDPLASVGLEDRVPNREDEWLALGEAGSAAPVVLRSFYDVLDNSRKAPKAKAFRRSISQAFGDPPNAAAEAFLGRDEALACVKTLGRVDECDIAFFWYIYRETGDEAFFDVTLDAFNYLADNLTRGKKKARREFLRDALRENLRDEYGEEGPFPPSSTPTATVEPVTVGGRVEVPEAGYALTLPDDWLIVRPLAADLETIVAGVGEAAPQLADFAPQLADFAPQLADIVRSGIGDGMSTTLMAFGPGPQGEATIQTCNVLTLPAGDQPMEDIVAAELAAFEQAGQAIVEGPDLLAYDFALGDVWRIDYRLLGHLDFERDISAYLFPSGPGLRSTLTCGYDVRPSDGWLSIAESFELLPAED